MSGSCTVIRSDNLIFKTRLLVLCTIHRKDNYRFLTTDISVDITRSVFRIQIPNSCFIFTFE